ncbi:MAG TPA: mechanosensitive ion channel protein MscS, partial [Microbacteriaceae bacterium]|nr:mechanosensitive ion channel protein MscS [Microbacteriaceae bacterium]
MIGWKSWPGLAIATVIGLALAVVIIVVTSIITRVAARRREWPKALRSSARFPYRLLLLIIAAWTAVALALPDQAVRGTVNHAFLIGTIAAGTWFVAAIVSFAIGLAMGRYRIDVPDNRVARRLQTQLIIVRRLASVVITIVGVASVLLTF